MFNNDSMEEILKYLKAQGERLDAEIAQAIGMSIAKVRAYLEELAGNGEVVTCQSIRFEKNKKIEGISCRLSGHTPPATPGRKSKPQLKSA